MNLDELKTAVIDMQDETVVLLVNEALKQNIDPHEILSSALIPGMKEVGDLFSRKEYFVPEVLLASEAFYAGFDILQPLISSKEHGSKATIVIGVVQGDIHDIGKNIVKVLVEASGYRVIDLGKDVPTARFIEAVEKEKPAVLALSSLMTTTMTRMDEIIKALKNHNLRQAVKVIVGGAPLDQHYADTISADGYASDAGDAVRLLDRLLG